MEKVNLISLAFNSQPADVIRKIHKAYETPLIENLDEFEGKVSKNSSFKPYGDLLLTYVMTGKSYKHI